MSRTPVIPLTTEVLAVDAFRSLAEDGCVFVVHVEHQDPYVRPRDEQFGNDRDDAARLPDTGRADDREVLGQELVRVKARLDARSLAQMADIERPDVAPPIHDLELLVADQAHPIADARILADAATECWPTVAMRDFADQVDGASGTSRPSG